MVSCANDHDEAVPDEAVLRARIENRLEVDVRHLIVQEIDFVRDATIVDVRFRRRRHSPQAAAHTMVGSTRSLNGSTASSAR